MASTKFMVNYGFESVVDPRADWAAEAKRLQTVGVGSVALSVGRPEWSAFPQDSRPGDYPGLVATGNRDFVREAMDGLRISGFSGDFTLSIDALMPLMLARDPHLAGTDANGRQSPEFPSAWALARGPVGEALEAFVDEVAARYQPSTIGLTELMIAEYSFGGQDLALYAGSSGNSQWPRAVSGTIDKTHASLSYWRSVELALFVARMARAARHHGVGLEMDVRAPAENERRGRPDSGHDYAMLLDVADRLAIWHYIGIDDYVENHNEAYVRSLSKYNEHSLVLSIGLWSDKGALSPAQLKDALTKCAEIPWVSITPASLMSDGHWRILQRQRG